MKNIYLFAFGLLLPGIALCQQDPLWTNWHHAREFFNPAFTATNSTLTVGAHYRNQWLKYEGAPKTMMLQCFLPLKPNRHHLGLSLGSDQIGITSTTFMDVLYAYTRSLNKNWNLMGGLNGRIAYGTIQTDKAIVVDGGDPGLNSGPNNIFYNNFGWGLAISNNKFMLGASMPRILKDQMYRTGNNDQVTFAPIYLMGSYQCKLSQDHMLTPALFVNTLSSAPFDATLELNYHYQERLDGFISYRLQDAINIGGGVLLNSKLYCGASFDIPVSIIRKVSPGSLELVLKYQFIQENNDVKNLRFF